LGIKPARQGRLDKYVVSAKTHGIIAFGIIGYFGNRGRRSRSGGFDDSAQSGTAINALIDIAILSAGAIRVAAPFGAGIGVIISASLNLAAGAAFCAGSTNAGAGRHAFSFGTNLA